MKVLVGLLLFFPLLCAAQVYRCTEGGKTILQQTPCMGSGTMVAPPSSPSTPQPQQRYDAGGSASARDLTALVAGAVAQRDYRRAQELAVTSEHWDMISQAKQLDIQNAQAERDISRRNRPVTTTCYSGTYGTRCITQ